MTIDDYIVLADIPKIQLESEEEPPGLKRRNQSPSPCRDQRLRTFRLVLPCDGLLLYGEPPKHLLHTLRLLDIGSYLQCVIITFALY